MLKSYFLKYIWYPPFCKYLVSTFNLRKMEYCILQKLYEAFGTDNINWMTYHYSYHIDAYLVIYEYIDPVYNKVIKGHMEFPARIFNRTYEE